MVGEVNFQPTSDGAERAELTVDGITTVLANIHRAPSGRWIVETPDGPWWSMGGYAAARLRVMELARVEVRRLSPA